MPAISRTALRKALGDALRPIGQALRTQSGAHKPVEFMGYRFLGLRVRKAAGQAGYVWNPEYSGTPCTHAAALRWPTQAYGTVGGNLDACAEQLYSRLRAEANDEGAPYTPPPETPNDREALRLQIEADARLQSWRERGVL